MIILQDRKTTHNGKITMTPSERPVFDLYMPGF